MLYPLIFKVFRTRAPIHTSLFKFNLTASIDMLSVSVFIYTFASACSFLTSGFSFLNKHFGYISTHALTRTCLAIEGVLTELTYCLPQRIVGKSEH